MSAPRAPQTDEIFDAAALGYHAAAPLLWEPLGEAYVGHVRPAPGERVLDACCGAGSTAFPAARAVGPTGLVDAVDVSSGLVELGRRQASAQGPSPLRFHVADVTAWSSPQPYDLLLCSYGVFFLPDMDASARRLADLVRPGGRFSVSAWARGSMADFAGLLHRTVRSERAVPGLPDEPNPAQLASMRLNTEDALGEWMTGLGLRDVSVHRHVHEVPLTPETAWPLVTGTGFHALLLGLPDDAVARVRDRFLGSLTTENVTVFDATTLIATGTP
ncbi:methyltransferase domain-containing protein [Actinocorallia sp. B10E7]|uniref:class I SAM-dependent methyltransferase n=1 Tax=Actinocorallia sp. B10E7 TaxID=3153558 RepID=UPI00325EF0FD